MLKELKFACCTVNISERKHRGGGDPLTYCSRGVTTKRTRGRKGGEVRAFSRNVEFTWHRCAYTVLHFALFKWPFLPFLLSPSPPPPLSLFFLIECYLVARAHNTDTRHRFRVRMSTSFRFRRGLPVKPE